MAEQHKLADRLKGYQPTKTTLFWSCAASIAVTLIVGFNWGGWVTGATAREMSAAAAVDGRAELAATVCVERFMTGPDAQAQLAALKGTDSWKQEGVVEKGGWVTLPGMAEPVRDAAEVCADRLVKLELPAKSADAAGGAVVK